MRWTKLAQNTLALAQVVHRWLGAQSKKLEPERKARVARYAEAIADTLARAANALAELECGTGDPKTAAQRHLSSAESTAMWRPSARFFSIALTDAAWLALKGDMKALFADH